MTIPDRLEHRAREPQIEDLTQPHLPEEVIDPVKLRLVEVLMDLVRQLAGRREIMAEGLLHHDPSGLRQFRLRQTLDHRPEQERGDLEVEHGGAHLAERRRETPVCLLGAEVAAQIRQPRREAVEDVLIDALAARLDRRARVASEIIY